MSCHNCKSNKTEVDDASGISVCINCGLVLEENRIVSEVAFTEFSGGKTIVQGSYAGESGQISGGGLSGRGQGRRRQNQAIENDISRLAHAVNLPERYEDAAQRYYNLAVVYQLTEGRRSDFVAAVCLYAVCRTEKSSHMLIDFSDVLQVNVFTLGAVFLKLCKELHLNLPLVDPSLYIFRFAAALDFGDYTQRVALDAVRIAQSMDRDWITSGRRPSGISGACLLLAARINGFRRTTCEMAYVAKVADITIQRRLKEFNQTESTELSVGDFKTVWLENCSDPPSFQKSRKGESSRAGEPEDDESMKNKDADADADDESEEDEDTEQVSGKRKRDANDTVTTPSKRIALKKAEKPVTGKRKMDASNDDEVVEKRPTKRNKGKEVDRSSQQEKYYFVPGSDDDDEVVGPIEGSQVDISEADNGVPEDEVTAKKKSNIELPNEEDLIQKQIEYSLNEGIREVAEITASLTAEATIKPEEDTQLNTQNTDMDSTLVNDDTLMKEDNSGIITIKDPEFEKLSTKEKKMLTSIAKEKVANEVAELLNPDHQEYAKKIADDMEQWLGDESIKKAASKIEKEKHANHKTGDDEEEEDEEEEEEDENLSEVDDEEIEAMILTDIEVALKTKIWYNANKAYLEEMAVRRVLETDKNYSHRKGKDSKKKKLPPPTTPAEAAKQLLLKKELSKQIDPSVFDDMFESPESIAKIKQRDAIMKINDTCITSTPTCGAPTYEVVEEPGDIPNPNAKKTKEGSDNDDKEKVTEGVEEEEEDDDDDDDIDSDDMADDERLLRDARAKYTFTDDDDDQPYYYEDEEVF